MHCVHIQSVVWVVRDSELVLLWYKGMKDDNDNAKDEGLLGRRALWTPFEWHHFVVDVLVVETTYVSPCYFLHDRAFETTYRIKDQKFI